MGWSMNPYEDTTPYPRCEGCTNLRSCECGCGWGWCVFFEDYISPEEQAATDDECAYYDYHDRRGSKWKDLRESCSSSTATACNTTLTA